MNYGYLGKENDLQRAQRELAERIYCMYLNAIEGIDADAYASKDSREATATEALKAAFAFFEMHKGWVDEAAVERYEGERK